MLRVFRQVSVEWKTLVARDHVAAPRAGKRGHRQECLCHRRKCKRYDEVAEFRVQAIVATGGDHQVLLSRSWRQVGHGHCVAAGRQLAAPKLSSAGLIERVEVLIECPGDKDQ